MNVDRPSFSRDNNTGRQANILSNTGACDLLTPYAIHKMEAPKRTRKRDAGSKILSSFLLLLTAACAPQVVDAALSCSSTAQCEETLRVGSECIDGTCTNPYHQRGCLAQRLPDWKRIRVCHSDDPPDAELSGYCRPPDPDLDYMEIRLLTQNWESAFFQSWVIQIILR